MVLEYSYDKANEILTLFKDSKIATLNIQPTKSEDGIVYLIDYTLIDTYVENKQKNMRKVLNESLPERLRVAELFNNFIEHQTLNNVEEFKLFFNIVDVNKCEINYFASFGDKANNISDIAQLEKCLEQCDSLITKMGICDITIPNVFRKEGAGKNRKTIPLTVKDITKSLRLALMEK